MKRILFDEQRDISVLNCGRKGYECFGSSKALKLVHQVVELFCITENDFDEHGIVASDAAAFDNVRNLLYKRIEVLFVCRRYFEIDKSFDIVAKFAVVYNGLIPLDYSFFFELLYP